MRSPAPASTAFRRIASAVPAASGAVVMGTAIVSIGLSIDGHETLSRVLLAIAALVWVALGLLFAGRLIRDRPRMRREAHSPAALTDVADAAVLGVRFALLGWSWAGIALLAIALALWLVSLPPVLTHWKVPTVGTSLMLTVSTQSLAGLAAVLSEHEHARWLVHAALVPLVLGLAFYLFVIAQFDFRQLAVGRGDHWITGGALAISALAAGRITLTAGSLHTLTGAAQALETLTLVLWALTMAWLPVLLAAEALHPRFAYDVRRWSTVFPVGMYAACSFIAAKAARVPGIADFARGWVWVGVVVWLVVFAATLRRGAQLVWGVPTRGDA